MMAAFTLLSGVACGQTSAAIRTHGGPLFSEFPVRELYGGPSAAPKFKSATDKNYLGRLMGGTAPAPNFAGQFRVVQFRMGIGPLGVVLVDSKTGSVFRLPDELVRDDFFLHDTDCLSGYRRLQRPGVRDEEDDAAPLSFKAESELLIIRQCRIDRTAVTAVDWSYYRWHGRKWHFLKRLSSPPPPVE